MDTKNAMSAQVSLPNSKVSVARKLRAEKLAQQVWDKFSETTSIDTIPEDVGSVYRKLSRLIGELPEKYFKAYEWASAILDIQTSINFLLLTRHIKKDNDPGTNYEAMFESYIKDLKLSLQEILGMKPYTIFQRERQQWINHWRGFYLKPNASEADKQEIIDLARKEYPDFDISELEAAESEETDA